MDIQKECNREAFEKYAALRCYYLNKNSDGSYCKANTALAWEIWREASAVPDDFVLVPKVDVHDHYVAEHLKGTTCSVDVSELTGNVGDRVYGKLRPYDCIGSDGNTLLYDLESSNFNMQRHTGNSGDYVLVPKECSDEMAEVIAATASVCGGIAGDVYDAVVKQAAKNEESLDPAQIKSK